MSFLNKRNAASTLRSLPVNPANPNPLTEEHIAILKLLREATLKAEAGKTQGLCLTATNEDGTYDIQEAGSYTKYPTDALGPLKVLELKLTRKALDELHRKSEQ